MNRWQCLPMGPLPTSFNQTLECFMRPSNPAAHLLETNWPTVKTSPHTPLGERRYIMGVTCIFILVFFKFFDRVWKPWRFVRSFGPLFVCLVGLAAVYIGQVSPPVCDM